MFEVCTCFLAQYDYSHDAGLDDQILQLKGPEKHRGMSTVLYCTVRALKLEGRARVWFVQL